MISPFISDIVQLLDRHMRLLDRVGSDEWNYETLTFAECIKCLITYTKFNKFLNIFTSQPKSFSGKKFIVNKCSVPDLEVSLQKVTVPDLEIDLQEFYCH